ncbi:MAG TPA: Rieske 2Fe-2S domain-containing protein [Streptosporangiaceae bacterium]|nr:Rieske 2Fe-2S domain-containing protein [Streptosporangiaceae bacterium]
MSDSTAGHGTGEHSPGEHSQGENLMADLGAEGGEPQAAEGTARRRIIGTPSPTQSRMLLAETAAGSTAGLPEVREPELPADPQDMDGAKGAERIVAACFILAMLTGFGFIAAYLIFQVHSVTNVLHSNLALGLTMGLAFGFMGAGATIWVRRVMPHVEMTEMRHPMRSEPENREAFAETWTDGVGASQFVKRPILRRTLIAATVPVAVAPIVLLRDLGPLPGTVLDHTVWRKGMRLLTYGANKPIRPGDFSSPGGMITVVPDGFEDDFNALAKAAAIIIKFAPDELEFATASHQVPGKTIENWTVDNIVAYSKICTHVGCPAALYEQTTHHILCPCHQSTFDATRGAQVIFGPATRALPQLPMTVDAEGFLVAKSDFTEPVGPSFWERGNSQ